MAPNPGTAITGRVETVIVGGRVVAYGGAIVGKAARGRHVPAGEIDLTPAVLGR